MAPAYHIEGADRTGRWVITVDHATNRVPPEIGGGDLGLSAADMARHIAWDVGAAGVARTLGNLLDAPVILSDVSRLVIDPNRGEDDPTLVMRLYDGTVIPANRGIGEAEIERRLNSYYRPYHGAVSQLIGGRTDAVILSVHTFTPQFRGRAPRPWHVGVLYADDDRLAAPLLTRLRDEPDLHVGDNEPYTGRLTGDSLDRHGVQAGRPHVLIEIRNDLIGAEAEQLAWADRLAPILDDALAKAQI